MSHIDEPDSARLIRNVLAPLQYTKLDPLVDIVEYIASDVSSEAEEALPKHEEEVEGKPYVTKLNTTELRNEAKEILTKKLVHGLKEISRSLLESEDGTIGVSYAQSHAYRIKPNLVQYWFALHDRQIQFLKKHRLRYLAYHCVDDGLILLPWEELEKLLNSFGETPATDKRGHWYHIFLQALGDGKIYLKPKAPHDRVDVTSYLLKP